MPEHLTDLQENKQAGFTPRELIFKYLRYLPWLVISVGVMLVLAYVNLRYTTPIYNVSGKLLVAHSSSRNGNEKFDDIFQMQGAGNNLNNEMEIIKSRFMAARVVKKLGLQLQYFNKGKIRTTTMHAMDMPFECRIVSLKDSINGLGFLVTIVNGNQFTVGEQSQLFNFGQSLNLPQAEIQFVKRNYTGSNFSSNQFIISWTPMENMAASLSSGIQVAKVNDFSDVLGIAYASDNTKLGLDIVNGFMQEYVIFGLEDKKQQADNTLDFIKDQLDTVRLQLGGVEGNLLNTKQRNSIFNPNLQSSMFFNELSEANKQITSEGVKLKLADILYNYVNDRSNPYRMVPSTMGIEEPTLSFQISSFNKLQLDRETALKTTPATNPLIKDYETGIEKLRTDMLQNLRQVRQGQSVTIDELNKKYREASSQISAIPGKEKVLLDATRQQSILQELYSFLLQKKLETAIASASTISNIKVLESPMASSIPVSPNRKALYIGALLLGIGIPVGIILLREYLNDKVKGKQDIERLTATPILGEIGHADQSGALVVTNNNRHFIAEQFRIIRSNLQYILPKTDKQVIMVTSSFSGEGKSFISTNLGAVLAVSGKRTVIMEFDIRKPKILEGLGMKERLGITNYIVGNIAVKDIIYAVPTVENLFVVPCGPVPPNPAEILLSEKVRALFTELQNQFDTIIIDTAPVGLVSDAVTLGVFANACAYIVRHNYTLKKQVQLIDDLYTQKKLPHLSIIVNDIEAARGYGGYGYGYGGYGYGYGYGYGAGSGYFEGQEQKKKSVFRKIKKWFS
ncbi:MAG: polysaccharide biosynthesis tyrosine autokinase [Ferruginibacter sp.]